VPEIVSSAVPAPRSIRHRLAQFRCRQQPLKSLRVTVNDLVGYARIPVGDGDAGNRLRHAGLTA